MMFHPCYICGTKVSNPLQELCDDHEEIFKNLAEKEQRKNLTINDFIYPESENEIFQLEKVSEAM